MEYENIIFFDGVCNLCNSSIQFIIKHDKKQKFRFCTLQSTLAQEILTPLHLDVKIMDSLVLYQEKKAFIESTGALKICVNLSWYLKIGWLGFLIPRFFRDYIYSYIAKNRYRWFGKKKTCMMPTEDLKSRFLP